MATSEQDTEGANESGSREADAGVFLASLIGRWRTRFRCDGAPGEITGAAEIDWVVEGASVAQSVETEVFGQRLRSVRLLAFNPLRGVIEATSMEGAGVGIATGHGKPPSAGAPFRLVSRVDEQHTRELDLFTETVHRVVSKDRHELEIFLLGPEGSEQVGMVVYERLGAAE